MYNLFDLVNLFIFWDSIICLLYEIMVCSFWKYLLSGYDKYFFIYK